MMWLWTYLCYCYHVGVCLFIHLHVQHCYISTYIVCLLCASTTLLVCVRLLPEKYTSRARVYVYSAIVVKMNELKRYSEKKRERVGGDGAAERRNKRGITI